MVHSDQDCKTGDGDTHGEYSVGEPMAGFVRQVCEDHGETKGSGPRRYAVKLGLNLAVAVTVNDRWTEVRIAARQVSEIWILKKSDRDVRVGGHDQAKVHEASEEDFVILEYVCDVLDTHLTLHGRGALFTAKAIDDECPLVFGEPFAVFGKIRKNEEECRADNASENSLEDENLDNSVSDCSGS